MGDSRVFLYPGLGEPLLAVAADTGNVRTGATTLQDGEWSESIAAHDCLEFLFGFSFENAASGGNDQILVQRSDLPTFDVYETHEAVGVADSKFTPWTSGGALQGFYRILNDSGRAVVCYMNKRIN